ncbi:MAG: RHS domain-containing protein [Deltaproteobacteria bacterium]|nr:RHS domain-containing protein [Deltaproteobacteria bacterium]
MVKFDRSGVADLLEPAEEVIITVNGEVGGVPFAGEDTIRVIDKGKKEKKEKKGKKSKKTKKTKASKSTSTFYATSATTQQAKGMYYYHPDHLGTPQVMTDENGAVVWKADYRPFGEADVTVNTVENNFRFPGQYYDEETGLHYNYFRDYHPGIGRYIEPDPLSLPQIQIVRHSSLINQIQNFLVSNLFYQYGLTCPQVLNLYSYVQNYPINLIDPSGSIVAYWGAGAAAGAGYKIHPKDQDPVTFLSATVTRYAGTTRNGGSNTGMVFSGGAGRMVGVAAGGGLVIGLNFGNVEDLASLSVSTGILLGPFSFELTFDASNSLSGFSFGFVSKGVGLGVFGQETRAATVCDR